MNLPTGYYLQKGKYQLLHVVGQGGFGITYKGILYTEVKGPLGRLKTEVPISIKEYFFKDYCFRDPNTYTVQAHSETGKLLFDKFKEKLIKEAKILSDVHHPHIVNVLDVFEENNTAYIAMEFIEGHSLKYILEKDGVLPEGKVLKYIHQIGEALQFVHETNILHLDIKPSNILIDKNDQARLIDFGVSKRYDVEDQETSTTMLTLSKGFASIEQYDNEGTQVFSPCPDIYSLGATMYNLLTGKIPTESILRAARPMKKPSELNPAISPKTEEVILKAMQVRPADRFQTVAEMMAMLDQPPKEEPKRESTRLSGGEGGSETTLLVTGASGKDDEQTLINDRPAVEKDENKKQKKHKKAIWFIALICIFVLIGSSVALLVNKGNSVAGPIQHSVDTLEVLTLTDTDTDEIVLANTTTKPSDTNTQPVLRDDEMQPTDDDSGETADTTGVAAGEGVSGELTEEEEELRYDTLLASGIAKMEKDDFVGATADFNQAAGIKPTQEVIALLVSNEEKAKEKRIADKKAQYEEKMPFGNFMIVRKKSNDRYGAIDDKGDERVPCKYLSVDIANEGRAFEREDKLFDIYNTNGVLVRSDVTY